jgi:hypothetical protein
MNKPLTEVGATTARPGSCLAVRDVRTHMRVITLACAPVAGDLGVGPGLAIVGIHSVRIERNCLWAKHKPGIGGAGP